MHSHLKNSRGVGLVEIMVGMVVLGVIGLSLANLLRSQHHAFTNQNEGIRATQNVRAGVEMLAEELQNAGLDPRAAAGAGFSTIDAGDIAWSADLNGDGDNTDLGDEPEQVRYYFSGDDEALYREVDGTSAMVADGIQSFTFTYLDGDQDVTADPNAIEYVDIAVSYETPDGVSPGALETKVPIRNRIFAMAGPGGEACYVPPGILVNGDIEVSGDARLFSCSNSLHTNGALSISGDATATGAVTASGSVSVSGSVQDGEGDDVEAQGGAETMEVPSYANPAANQCDDADYRLKSNGQVEVVATQQTYDATGDEKFGWKRSSDDPVTWTYSSDQENPGTYCVDGNVEFSGNPGEGNADPVSMSIIAKGSIEVSGNPHLTADSENGHLFMAGGDLKINGNATGGIDYSGSMYAYSQCMISGNPVLSTQLTCKDQPNQGHAENYVDENEISGEAEFNQPCGGEC